MRLSPSTLNLFKDCARCFWLDKNKKIKRPRGPFPSLPGGMDRVIKAAFDIYRPGEAPGFDEILLIEQEKVDLWRNWRKGLSCNIKGTSHTISGALDDCLFLRAEQKYAPLDYKTRGSSVPDFADYAKKYYQLQMDVYSLMLEENGYPSAGKAYLAFYYPEEANIDNNVFRFKASIVSIPTSIDNALEVIKQALQCLEGPMPEANPKCEYCARHVALNEIT